MANFKALSLNADIERSKVLKKSRRERDEARAECQRLSARVAELEAEIEALKAKRPGRKPKQQAEEIER